MENEEIESAIGYTFGDKELLLRARTLKGADQNFNNESLECLGDAILGFLVAEKYYLLGYDEGAITERKKSVASDEALRRVSVRLGLDRALIRPKGRDNNKKAIPSAYEAMVAAVYEDGGLDAAKRFVYSTLDFDRHDVDYIAALQEELQGKGYPLPEYGDPVDNGTQTQHDFSVTVTVLGKSYKGRGVNSQQAKKGAAQAAYQDIKTIR